MRVKNFILQNFRNIKKISLNPCETSNIIFGDNAQGKTNLLEAIWIFSGARSFRGSKDGEYTKFEEDTAKLELEFFAKNRIQSASISFIKDKKNVLLNEIKQESVTGLIGEFCAVVFSPDHLSIIKQGPEKRRKLIDISLCQAFPKYIKVLDSYNRLLRQRNALLKDIGRRPSLYDTLEVWDKAIIDYGAYITLMRARYVKKLAETASEIYNGISSNKEKFSATYAPGFDIGNIGAFDRDEIRHCLENAIINSRGDDVRIGSTSAGPHRDDMYVSVDGLNAKSYGSQGQQRSCVLSLKLAECSILEERNGEPPVVLLDDVMSELDHNRRNYLVNSLKDKQIFITCCDAKDFSEMNDGRVFQIKDGALI